MESVDLVLARVYQSGRLVLRLEDFKPEWVDMLLRVDDPRFYHHPGVDMMTPGGGLTTITQGLVKAYFFNGFRPGFLRINKIRQSLIPASGRILGDRLRLRSTLAGWRCIGSNRLHGRKDASRR